MSGVLLTPVVVDGQRLHGPAVPRAHAGRRDLRRHACRQTHILCYYIGIYRIYNEYLQSEFIKVLNEKKKSYLQ